MLSTRRNLLGMHGYEHSIFGKALIVIKNCNSSYKSQSKTTGDNQNDTEYVALFGWF